VVWRSVQLRDSSRNKEADPVDSQKDGRAFAYFEGKFEH